MKRKKERKKVRKKERKNEGRKKEGGDRGINLKRLGKKSLEVIYGLVFLCI